MRLDFSNESVLAVVAHPDDAELLCAGTLARAKAEGAEIAISVVCHGDKGQPEEPIEDLANVRLVEVMKASQILGANTTCLGVPDSTLQDDPHTRELLIECMRFCRPTLVLAHSPTDYHTDHRAASQLAEVCSWLSASRGQVTSHPPLDAAPAVWWMDTIGMQQFEPAFYVDISDYVDVKEQMLACHQSQIGRSGDADFTPLLDLMRNQMHTRGRQSGVTAAEAFRPHHVFKRSRAW